MFDSSPRMELLDSGRRLVREFESRPEIPVGCRKHSSPALIVVPQDSTRIQPCTVRQDDLIGWLVGAERPSSGAKQRELYPCVRFEQAYKAQRLLCSFGSGAVDRVDSVLCSSPVYVDHLRLVEPPVETFYVTFP